MKSGSILHRDQSAETSLHLPAFLQYCRNEPAQRPADVSLLPALPLLLDSSYMYRQSAERPRRTLHPYFPLSHLYRPRYNKYSRPTSADSQSIRSVLDEMVSDCCRQYCCKTQSKAVIALSLLHLTDLICQKTHLLCFRRHRFRQNDLCIFFAYLFNIFW